MLDRCTDAALVAHYKSFPKRMKAERNAFAGGHINGAQLQEKLRQLRTERAECVHRIADATGEGVVTVDDLRLFAADASLFADAEDAVEQRLMAEEVEPAWL